MTSDRRERVSRTTRPPSPLCHVSEMPCSSRTCGSAHSPAASGLSHDLRDRFGRWFSGKIRRQVFTAVILDCHQQARPVRKLAAMNDFRSVCTGDRHRMTRSAGVDFHDVSPANSLVLPEPGDLFQTIGGYDYACRKWRGNHSGGHYEGDQNQDVIRSSIDMHQPMDRSVDQIHDQNGPRPECAPVWGELDASLFEWSGLPQLVGTSPEAHEQCHRQSEKQQSSGYLNEVLPVHRSDCTVTASLTKVPPSSKNNRASRTHDRP